MHLPNLDEILAVAALTSRGALKAQPAAKRSRMIIQQSVEKGMDLGASTTFGFNTLR